MDRHRAIVAFLLGKREAAARFAGQAIELYRRDTWTPRQQPSVMLAIAEAEAFSGQKEAALRDGRAALERYHEQHDDYAAILATLHFATIQLILDRRDDALATLRQVKDQPGILPQVLRTDLFWSRLKDDPRFEEILKSVKLL